MAQTPGARGRLFAGFATVFASAWLVTLTPGAAAQSGNATNLTEPFRAEGAQGDPLLVGTLLLTATVALILAIFVVNRLHRWVHARFEALAFERLRSFEVGKIKFRSADWTRRGLVSLANGGRLVLLVTLLLVYVPFVLSLFQATEGFYRRLIGLVRRNVAVFGEAITGYLPNLVYILLVAAIAAIVLKVLKALSEQVYQGHVSIRGFYPSWAQPTYILVRVALIAFVLVLILPRLPGFGSDAFQGISIFVGALVALGASSAMANIVSGTLLIYTRAFSVGDRVEIADTLGDVVERSLLITRIRTIKNEDITIPNSEVLSGYIVNYSGLSKDRPLILHTSVSIGYDVPWRTVRDLLIEAGHETEGVLEDPEPFVLQNELGDFAATYQLNVYTDRPDAMARMRSVLHENIRDRFEAEGVEILSPDHLALRESKTLEKRVPTPPPGAVEEEPSMPVEPDAGDTSEVEQARIEKAEAEARADEAAEEDWAEQEQAAESEEPASETGEEPPPVDPSDPSDAPSEEDETAEEDEAAEEDETADKDEAAEEDETADEDEPAN